MSKRKGRQTTIERLTELREELDIKKKKRKKSGIKQIDIQKMSKKKRKKLKSRLNPELVIYYNSYSKEEKDLFWAAYEKNYSIYNHEEYKEKNQRKKENREKREKYVNEKLADIDAYDIDDLIKIDKVVSESYDKKRFKKFKKFGYEIGEDDIIYVNEDKLIDSLKKRRKELRKINETYQEYLESVMGEDSKYMTNLKAVDRKITKETKDLIKSFEAVAMESSIFRLK